MRAAVTTNDGKSATTETTQAKPKTIDLTVPARDIDTTESISLGFRQEMLRLGDGKDGGSVSTGSGLGTDAIILTWKGRRVLVNGLDLLRSWVATFAPEDAERFPKRGEDG